MQLDHEALRKVIAGKGVKGRWIASKLAMYETDWSRVKTGAKAADDGLIRRIAAVLGVTVEEICRPAEKESA